FFITLILGGLFSFIFLLISLFLGYFLLGILIFTVGVPLLALITGSIVYLDSLIYSVFAKKFGGIDIELKKEEK
ncbi:MAG: hypothetical protein KKH98_12120, partial [Spirochaetes bacterium]|nr:hypothetical protein [Spirochaetota bacterium]